MILSVREIKEKDIPEITDYWLNADENFMHGMGVDLSKIPSREQWKEMLLEQINANYPEKKSYCMIWELDGKPVGHSNVNKIIFGEEAYMHIHLWFPEVRKQGWGTAFIEKTIPFFLKNLQLKKLFCEPYALNAAPNKTLPRLGFTFVKEYVTTPGWINFEQPVKLWVMEKKGA